MVRFGNRVVDEASGLGQDFKEQGMIWTDVARAY